MKITSPTKFRTAIIVIALCILTGGIGYRLGEAKTSVTLGPDKRVIVNQQSPSSVNVDFSVFWDVWGRLSRSWIDRATMDPQKMVWGAITGMVNSLGDPYTSFLPPQQNKDFKQELGGSFEGIGAELGLKDGHIVVISPLKGNPAEKEGIRAGDFILKVDGADTTDWTVSQAVDKIRGPGGTKVTLSILHETDTKPIDISITRSTIVVPSVDSWVKAVSDIKEITGVTNPPTGAARVAYIRLSQFGDSSNSDWDSAVSDIVSAGPVKGLIFDLRNNPGGYLDGAVYISSEFIKSGTVVSQVNSDGTRQDYPVVRRGKLLDIPVVVLVNKGSASAAEITAGALRDFKRATVVGETSFGKGTVQTPEDLPDGSSVHITTGRWLLPNGDSIAKKGITPDVAVAWDGLEASADAQLSKAVELLLK
jgi:carboxyl-terminal processing protease